MGANTGRERGESEANIIPFDTTTFSSKNCASWKVARTPVVALSWVLRTVDSEASAKRERLATEKHAEASVLRMQE